jgi:carbon monoxide dehydrogenase subunit G
MRFEEQIRVPVSVKEAWDFLWQTKRLAACLPGCTGVEEIETGKKYKAQVEDHVGPFRVHFDLDVLVEKSETHQHIQVSARGQDRRLGASQNVLLDVKLAEVDGRETVLDIAADVQILGKIATLGQFVIKRKVKDIVNQFTQNVKDQLKPRS